MLEWLQQDTAATAATAQGQPNDDGSTESVRCEVDIHGQEGAEGGDAEEQGTHADDLRGIESAVGAWLGRLRQHVQTRPDATDST